MSTCTQPGVASRVWRSVSSRAWGPLFQTSRPLSAGRLATGWASKLRKVAESRGRKP
ncbi:hypothetical protein Q3H58_004164 [Pseudomonas psychrotolerans]|nr:hypothetical protein [Pseudomonas psychrotolerans]